MIDLTNNCNADARMHQVVAFKVIGPYDKPHAEFAVVTFGASTDWACYIGEYETPEIVARGGCKVTKEKAIALFPQFNPDTYRR